METMRLERVSLLPIRRINHPLLAGSDRVAFRPVAREESRDFCGQVNGNIIIAVGRYSL